MDDAALERFADLAVGFGANVQPGQIVAVECEPGKEYLVRAIAAGAYRHGARFVDVVWFDPHVKRARIGHANPRTLEFVPPWYGRRLLALGDWQAAYVGLSGPSAPALLSDLDPALVGKDRLPMLKEATKVIDDRTMNWTVVPCPTPAWAELVFPELDPAGALERLEREVLHVLRLDEEDPIAAWRARVDTLAAGAARLTERRFDALHFAGPGTDLEIGLLPAVALGGRALRDRRRARAHAEPAHGGGLHDPGSGADERHGDVDQAARADRRHGGARPGRALRGAAGRSRSPPRRVARRCGR